MMRMRRFRPFADRGGIAPFEMTTRADDLATRVGFGRDLVSTTYRESVNARSRGADSPSLLP
jgi:hypothetical protein